MKALAFCTLSLLVSCVPSPKENKTSAGAINASSPYLWSDKAFPKTLQLSTSFTAAEVTAITDMSTAWKTSVSDQKTFFDYGTPIAEKANTTVSMDSFADATLGIYRASSWPATLPGSALAVTQIFGRRYNIGSTTEFVNIEHADILINYNYSFDTAASGTGYDLRTVVLHEMGHFLGLQHRDDTTDRTASVMYPSIRADESKQIPQAIDSSDLTTKYIAALTAESTDHEPEYEIRSDDPGELVKIQIELFPDGKCVHKENGAEIQRHSVSVK